MDWLLRNLSLLAFLIVLGMGALAVLVGVPILLRVIPRVFSSSLDGWSIIAGLGGLLYVVILALGVLVAYGLVVRFLALCDDIAAIRRTQTGTRSALD